MAKKQEVSTGKSKFQEALDALNKKYGEGTILSLGDKSHNDYDLISTGSIAFDHIALGVGGLVKGKLYELVGWEGCLSEETYIKFINVRPDGIVQDCKGSSIKNLYERFHNRTELTKDTVFHVTSINENNKVFRNQIANVVKSGVKECFKLTTKSGKQIEATKDHKFYTGTNYVPLSELTEGSIVFIHNNTPYTKDDESIKKKYKEITLKWYHKGSPRKINGYWFFREKVHRLVYEANMNGLSYEEYKLLLNSNTSLPDNWNTIPEGLEVHHIDENTLNNDVSNLQLIDSSSHSRLHALDRQDNLRFMVIPDEIVSIISVGEKETYDIKCFFPYNNFIAEGIVVHNSGKSTICGHAAANCQKNGDKVLYIDGEHAVDPNYFTALGVDISKMLIAQPSHGEEGFQIALDMIETGEVGLVIIDSDSSLIPKKVLDGDIGESSIGRKAKLNSDSYPKLKGALSRNNTCVIVVSQYREKIGMMFGDPRTTQGGHALKFYADVRIEVSKTLAKEGTEAYGNLTKIKTIKNKMAPPLKAIDFEVVFGKGIDQFNEIMTLGSEHDILRKYGKTITYSDVKYSLDEFRTLLEDNDEFFDKLRQDIIDAINSTEKEVVNEINEIENEDFIQEISAGSTEA
jgi:recombination protein RecA